MESSSVASRKGLHREHRLLAGMLQDFGPGLQGALHRVEALLSSLGATQMDQKVVRQITFRHSLILYAGAAAYGSSASHLEDLACGAVLSYSLPLIAVDSVIDMHEGAVLAPEGAAGFATSHALTHAGYAHIAQMAGHAAPLAHIAYVALATTLAMQRDLQRRYVASSGVGSEYVDNYWSDALSRINGSGVARLMLGLISIVEAGAESEDVKLVGMRMGQLRQIADELLDVVEDVQSGLITLPVAYALLGADGAAAAVAVSDLQDPKPDRNSGAGESLRKLILESGAVELIQAKADDLFRQSVYAARRAFPYPEYVVALLLQRRLQIERAITQGLRDDVDRRTVDDLLRLEGCHDWLLESTRVASEFGC